MSVFPPCQLVNLTYHWSIQNPTMINKYLLNYFSNVKHMCMSHEFPWMDICTARNQYHVLLPWVISIELFLQSYTYAHIPLIPTKGLQGLCMYLQAWKASYRSTMTSYPTSKDIFHRWCTAICHILYLLWLLSCRKIHTNISVMESRNINTPIGIRFLKILGPVSI